MDSGYLEGMHIQNCVHKWVIICIAMWLSLIDKPHGGTTIAKGLLPKVVLGQLKIDTALGSINF